MKPIKMFGFAVMAMLMAMAFAGVSSAMAGTTALCSEDPGEGEHEGCEGELVAHMHETTTTKAKLLASPEVHCDVLFLGDVTSELSAFLIIEGNFTFANCGAGCSVTEEGGPFVILVRTVGHEAAQVIGEGEVHVNCFGINCYYNGVGLEGAGRGPLLSTAANGEVNISGQTVKNVKGAFCPKEGKLDINTTPLKATYITE